MNYGVHKSNWLSMMTLQVLIADVRRIATVQILIIFFIVIKCFLWKINEKSSLQTVKPIQTIFLWLAYTDILNKINVFERRFKVCNWNVLHSLTSINRWFHSLEILVPVVKLSLRKLSFNEDIIWPCKSLCFDKKKDVVWIIFTLFKKLRLYWKNITV